MLKTPENIRELQRKLYRKAKQGKKFRFYLLYDKVCRLDILTHAYNLVKANRGAPGVDGETFERIEEKEGAVKAYLEAIVGELKRKEHKPQPVRRVYIPKASGGKRPLGIPVIKDRVVQMAVKIVIDADISKYFDTIPHDKLMQLVAKRIVDKQILKLIRMWLEVPVVEEREDKKKEYKRNDKGTPQGGVISPHLANIYLNILDTVWKLKKVQERFGARLVRYADDCVVLCEGNAGRVLEGMRKVLDDLGLNLNEEKTKIVDARKESFSFLGFSLRMRRALKTSTLYSHAEPSKKALKRIRAEVKRLTNEQYSAVSMETVIRRVNGAVRGRVNYFYYGNCTRAMSALRNFVVHRIRICRRRKHHCRSFGYRAYPDSYYYESLGLYKVPVKAPWTLTVKAAGRR